MNYLINQLMPGTNEGAMVTFLRRTAAVMGLSVLLIACASVPHTGRRQFNFVSDKQLNGLALKAFNEVVDNETISDDERLTRIVRRVTDRVSKAAEANDHPNFDWEVVLVERDEPNAFCLPGGKIVVFEGIAKYARNEAGLAAVIAHEVAHAVARHGGERLSQDLALKGALALGGHVLSKKDGKLDRKARLILAALGLGATVGVVLPYSRVHEFEADRIGQTYMALAGYDPKEAVRLWDRMSRRKKPPIPIWLSTHPPTQERIQKLREFLPDARKYYNEAPQKYGRGSLL